MTFQSVEVGDEDGCVVTCDEHASDLPRVHSSGRSQLGIMKGAHLQHLAGAKIEMTEMGQSCIDGWMYRLECMVVVNLNVTLCTDLQDLEAGRCALRVESWNVSSTVSCG